MTLANDGKGGTSSVLGSGTQQIATIQLAGATYMQTGGTGTWMEYPASTPETPTPSNPASSMDIGVGAAGVTFKYIDSEACGSFTCYKYQAISTSQAGTTQYVLFDKDSYLLREWISTNASGDKIDMSLTYGSVAITVPSPVQQFSASGYSTN